MNRLRVTYKYLQHWLTARCSYGFGVHSPFIYHFTRFIIYEKNSFYIFPHIETIRKDLIRDNKTIETTDFGTGKSGIKKISIIAKRSLKSTRQAQLLYRMVKEFKPQTILELGTSLGITTSYLASANKESLCITMEGCPATAGIAKNTFDRLQIQNIRLVVGDINEKLPAIIQNTQNNLDFIFIDANHSSKAVLNYFGQCINKIHENTILVVDDIYWSKDMEHAWETIKSDKKATATIDLFHIGIVFFNPELHKKHYKMHL